MKTLLTAIVSFSLLLTACDSGSPSGGGSSSSKNPRVGDKERDVPPTLSSEGWRWTGFGVTTHTTGAKTLSRTLKHPDIDSVLVNARGEDLFTRVTVASTITHQEDGDAGIQAKLETHAKLLAAFTDLEHGQAASWLANCYKDSTKNEFMMQAVGMTFTTTYHEDKERGNFVTVAER